MFNDILEAFSQFWINQLNQVRTYTAVTSQFHVSCLGIAGGHYISP
jgi:hypothetical protein